jgi:hypothetical protein
MGRPHRKANIDEYSCHNKPESMVAFHAGRIRPDICDTLFDQDRLRIAKYDQE